MSDQALLPYWIDFRLCPKGCLESKSFNCFTTQWTLHNVIVTCQSTWFHWYSGMNAVEATNQDGTRVWYYKPDQTSITEEVIDTRGNLLLNGHVVKLSSKHLCIYT